MADAYVTGHRPKETYFQLVSRLNATSAIMEMPETARGPSKPKIRLPKKLRKLLQYFPASIVMGIVQKTHKLVDLRGELYATWLDDDGLHFRAARSDAETRTVIRGECTCPDHKFRDKICKHMEYVNATYTTADASSTSNDG